MRGDRAAARNAAPNRANHTPKLTASADNAQQLQQRSTLPGVASSRRIRRARSTERAPQRLTPPTQRHQRAAARSHQQQYRSTGSFTSADRRPSVSAPARIVQQR